MKIKYIKSKDPRSYDFNLLVQNKFSQLLIENNPDLIIISGGDGSILHAIQKYGHIGAPFLGRAAGTLNFLMNKFGNDEETLNNLLNNLIDLKILETQSIDVSIKKKNGKRILSGFAVNEVIIGSDVMGYHNFIIDSEDKSFEDFEVKGSGLCVSTDLGSTGYNFNLGGPVIPLGSGFWSIQGIVANRMINDLLKHQKISIKCVSSKPHTQVFLDGIRNGLYIEKDDVINLSVGNTTKIAFIDDTDFAKRRIDITSRYRKS